MTLFRRSKFLVALLLTLAFLCLAFKKGDLIEIETWLNGRSSANFLKSTRDNIQFVLPPNSRGEVQEVKEFRSGNVGLKITVKTGPHAGKEAWVLWRPDQKLLKRIDPPDGKEDGKPQGGDRVRTEGPVPAIEASSPPTSGTVARDAQNLNGTLAGAGRPQTVYCDPGVVQGPGPGQIAAQRETSLRAPAADRNPNPYSVELRSLVNEDRGSYTVQIRGDDKKVESFSLDTQKETDSPAVRHRLWDFYSNGETRQDLHVSVTDVTGVSEDMVMSSLYLFPRKFVPSIRQQGGVLDVTLPTGEVVQYDANTRAILGRSGALVEEAIDSKNLKALPRVKYQGSGVMVRIDSNRKKVPEEMRGTQATISKRVNGQLKTCQVPIEKLFVEAQKTQGGEPIYQFKYPTDAGFDQFLKSETRCGFSIE